MRLYIVRHGDAERRAPTDAERPLTAAGRAQVRALWGTLNKEKVQVRRLVSSPYRRARETAETIADANGGLPDVEISPLLVPEAAVEEVLDWLDRQGDSEGLALISHMPLVGLLGGALLEGVGGRFPFSVGTVACLDMEAAVPAAARLLWVRGPDRGTVADRL